MYSCLLIELATANLCFSIVQYLSVWGASCEKGSSCLCVCVRACMRFVMSDIHLEVANIFLKCESMFVLLHQVLLATIQLRYAEKSI